jgi:hypothetical protein
MFRLEIRMKIVFSKTQIVCHDIFKNILEQNVGRINLPYTFQQVRNKLRMIGAMDVKFGIKIEYAH